MQGKHEYQPELFSQIDYENLIPKGHLLRRIDRVLDLSFLPELTKPLYAESLGRPSIDPVVFVRMVLLGYLYNIDSDRQLSEEVGYNLAYRWFCRLSLKDAVPDHSSLTRIRDRLGEEIYKKIFLGVVEQCQRAGLVKAERVMADGSIIKANASIYNMEERGDLTQAPEGDDDKYIDTTHSKDGLSSNDMRRGDIRGKKISNETHVSRSDPDSTLAGKAHEYKALAYKTHHIMDADSRVVMDCHVTTGAVSEVKVLPDRVDAVKRNLGITIGETIADRGYGSAENLQALHDREINTNIPLWSTRSGQSLFKDMELGFQIDHEKKSVTCPAGFEMKRRGRDNTHKRDRFEMRSKKCLECPLADRCLTEIERKNGKKTFYVSDFHHVLMATHEKQKNPEFRSKLQERMWKMEGIFAEAKSHHGMRRARYRGRSKVQIQVFMTATVQNLKRLAGAILFYFRSVLSILCQNQIPAEKNRESWVLA